MPTITALSRNEGSEKPPAWAIFKRQRPQSSAGFPPRSLKTFFGVSCLGPKKSAQGSQSQRRLAALQMSRPASARDLTQSLDSVAVREPVSLPGSSDATEETRWQCGSVSGICHQSGCGRRRPGQPARHGRGRGRLQHPKNSIGQRVPPRRRGPGDQRPPQVKSRPPPSAPGARVWTPVNKTSVTAGPGWTA